MQQIINGDTDKVGLLYEKYNNLLFGYFFKLTKNLELSEDLVNDVFLKILHSKKKYRGDGIFRVWMFRIAHSIFIDNYHKSKKMILKEVIKTTYERAEDTELEYDRREDSQLIHKALLKLKKKEREVIVLSKLDGLKYKEVAEILQCTEEAVKVRTFRALKNLKVVLEKIQN
jgi:RNA polymerase sigma-70 factor (ECF subfamily)